MICKKGEVGSTIQSQIVKCDQRMNDSVTRRATTCTCVHGGGVVGCWGVACIHRRGDVMAGCACARQRRGSERMKRLDSIARRTMACTRVRGGGAAGCWRTTCVY